MERLGNLRDAVREARREALLGAAESLFGDKGFEGTTIEAIARRAGVAKGSFYLHFHSKDHVFLSIISQRTERLLAEAARISTAPGSVRDRLEGVARATLEFHDRSRNACLALLFDKGVDPRSVMARFHEVRRQMIAVLEDIFRKGMESGEVLRDEAGRLSSLFLGCVQGTVGRWMDGDRAGGPREEAAWLVERFLNGIRAAGGRAS